MILKQCDYNINIYSFKNNRFPRCIYPEWRLMYDGELWLSTGLTWLPAVTVGCSWDAGHVPFYWHTQVHSVSDTSCSKSPTCHVCTVMLRAVLFSFCVFGWWNYAPYNLITIFLYSILEHKCNQIEVPYCGLFVLPRPSASEQRRPRSGYYICIHLGRWVVLLWSLASPKHNLLIHI